MKNNILKVADKFIILIFNYKFKSPKIHKITKGFGVRIPSTRELQKKAPAAADLHLAWLPLGDFLFVKQKIPLFAEFFAERGPPRHKGGINLGFCFLLITSYTKNLFLASLFFRSLLTDHIASLA